MRSGPRIVRVRLTGRVCTGFLVCDESVVTGSNREISIEPQLCYWMRSVGYALRLLLLLLLLLDGVLGVVLGRRRLAAWCHLILICKIFQLAVVVARSSCAH